MSNGDSSSSGQHQHPTSPNVFLTQQRQQSACGPGPTTAGYDNPNHQNLTVTQQGNHVRNGLRRHSGSNSQRQEQQHLGAEGSRERRKLSGNSSMSTSALLPTATASQPQHAPVNNHSQFRGNPSPSHSKKELQKVASAPSMDVSPKNQPHPGSQQQQEVSGTKTFSSSLLEKRSDTSSSLPLGAVVVKASECATPNPASAITDVSFIPYHDHFHSQKKPFKDQHYILQAQVQTSFHVERCPIITILLSH